jgi:hypothetical protein
MRKLTSLSSISPTLQSMWAFWPSRIVTFRMFSSKWGPHGWLGWCRCLHWIKNCNFIIIFYNTALPQLLFLSNIYY